MPLCKNPRCKAPVVLGETANGKTMVLDREQTTDGTYMLKAVAFGLPLAEYVGVPLSVAEGGTGLAYRVHFASCKGRGERALRGWRKRAADSSPQPPTS